MEKLTTPQATIELRKGEVVIRHRQTGMVTTTTAKQLENWAIRQLRSALNPQPKVDA